jgi:hypothetical protein
MMRRWIAALALLALSVAPASARGPETLTPEVKQQLGAAPMLRALGDRVPFDGRPVLVKFFASW